MSMHVHVAEYGALIHTICDTCGIEQRHALYKDANQASRQHNAAQHPITRKAAT